LEPVAEKLILSSQSAFMKKRNIMSGVMALHEILHETKRRKMTGVILKLDFEKAYDKVCWDFLFNSLVMRNFSPKWCGWIKQVVMGGTVCVKINNVMGPYFVSHKGVRQGDPLSPILFNFVADCLSRMVRKAQHSNLIIGLADNLIPRGVAILQYADDTIICLKDVSWKWGRNKIFTTKSTYDHLTVGQSRGHFNHIWKAKIPYKIKIFTWLLEKDVVLTKDNLIRRNWLGNPSCIFCGQLETSKHLFFQCPVARCI